jgi:hypothetical protein
MQSIHETILEFPDSASTSVATKSCKICSSAMEYRNTRFFYREKRWQVRLPACPKCNPDKVCEDT